MIQRIRALTVLCAFWSALSGCGPVKAGLIYYGLVREETDPALLNEQLQAHDGWYLPEISDSPYPGVLLVPGCAGTHEFHRAWAQDFVEWGFVALLIDSFRARGIETEVELEAVCEGEKLWGFERAGDVLVSLQRLRTHPQVNEREIYMIGWSHGGWAVLDAVALGTENNRPPMLRTPLDQPLSGVRAVAALYPYCGFGNHVARFGWPDDSIRGLFVIAGRDRNIEPEPSISLATRLRSEDLPIELLSLEADHWFDNPGGFHIDPHAFSAEATERTRHAILTTFGGHN